MGQAVKMVIMEKGRKRGEVKKRRMREEKEKIYRERGAWKLKNSFKKRGKSRSDPGYETRKSQREKEK